MIPLNEITRVEKEINNIIICIVEADRELGKYRERKVRAINEGVHEAQEEYRDRIEQLDKTIKSRKAEIYQLLIGLRERS